MIFASLDLPMKPMPWVAGFTAIPKEEMPRFNGMTAMLGGVDQVSGHGRRRHRARVGGDSCLASLESEGVLRKY
jgi:hypothetical protein